MIINNLPLSRLYLVKLEPLKDERGIFARLFCERELKEILGDRKIVNINFSYTFKKGTIRGMHFQKPPMAEMKFVSCLKGRVFDVAIDLRQNSSTFLSWYGTELSDKDMKMLCIPEGFAHGFQSLEDGAELLYFHTAFYSKENESAIHFADPKIGVSWPLPVSNISEKDKGHSFLKDDYAGMTL